MIRVENLTKVYKIQNKRNEKLGTVVDLISPIYNFIKAVDDISFVIKPGEIIGFIGPNGAGKSTTLRMLTGILEPSSGSVKVNGFIPIKQRRKYVKTIGAIFGNRSTLWPELPAKDAYELLKHMYNVDTITYKNNLNMLYEALEIGNLVNRPVRELSLGQKMRCEFASAFIHSPKLVFLDEPTIGMDIQTKKNIRELLKIMNKKNETTIIMTSHDLQEIEDVCKRLIIINKGKIVFDNTNENLRAYFNGSRKIIIKPTKVEKCKELQNKVLALTNNDKHVVVKISDKSTINITYPSNNFEISNLMSGLSNDFNLISDIVIQETPIEEIITSLFVASKWLKDSQY